MIIVFNSLSIVNTNINYFSKCITIYGDLYLNHLDLESLPSSLIVHSGLYRNLEYIGPWINNML